MVVVVEVMMGVAVVVAVADVVAVVVVAMAVVVLLVVGMTYPHCISKTQLVHPLT